MFATWMAECILPISAGTPFGAAQLFRTPSFSKTQVVVQGTCWAFLYYTAQSPFTRRKFAFQKYYTQSELQEYLQAELGTEAIAAAPGVFYVFRDKSLQQQFLANRYRRRSAGPRKRLCEVRFEENRELLEPLISIVGELGRLPLPEEFSQAEAVVERFGSLRRAFALVRRVTDAREWQTIRQNRTQDLLVYLALARFRKRPPVRSLPLGLQADIGEFFGNYRRACQEADELLFRAGSPEAINEACARSSRGKLLPNALYVHASALDSLDPILRIYEG